MSSGYLVTVTCPCGAKFSVDASSYHHGESAEIRFVDVHRQCVARAIELQTSKHIQEAQLYERLHRERGQDGDRISAALLNATSIAEELADRLRAEMEAHDESQRKLDALIKLSETMLGKLTSSPGDQAALSEALASIKSEPKPSE